MRLPTSRAAFHSDGRATLRDGQPAGSAAPPSRTSGRSRNAFTAAVDEDAPAAPPLLAAVAAPPL